MSTQDGQSQSTIVAMIDARARKPANTKAGAAAPKGRQGVNLCNGADIKPEAVTWLWDGWIARGKPHMLAGAPGTGKTTLTMALAAALTTGGRWPDGTHPGPADVVIWSGEDDPKDTLAPRLIACGADMSRVRFVVSTTDHKGESRAFDPATDAQALSDALALLDPPPALLIVDPLVSAVAGDSNQSAVVRRALQPLVDLAQARDCAVLGVSHFSKGTAGRDPVERVTGSLAFGALPRVVLGAAKLPEAEGGGRLLVRAKNNLGPDAGGFRYHLEPCELETHPGVFTVRVLWGEKVEGEARELLGAADIPTDPEEHTALEEAKGFLGMVLEKGPVLAKEIYREAEEAGHARRTLHRAKAALGIEARKEGYQGKWEWALPPKVANEAKGCHPTEKAPLQYGPIDSAPCERETPQENCELDQRITKVAFSKTWQPLESLATFEGCQGENLKGCQGDDEALL